MVYCIQSQLFIRQDIFSCIFQKNKKFIFKKGSFPPHKMACFLPCAFFVSMRSMKNILFLMSSSHVWLTGKVWAEKINGTILLGLNQLMNHTSGTGRKGPICSRSKTIKYQAIGLTRNVEAHAKKFDTCYLSQ